MFLYLLRPQITEMKKQTLNPTFLSWELSDEAATADKVPDFQEETVHAASGAWIAHYQQNNPPSPYGLNIILHFTWDFLEVQAPKGS